MDGDFKGDFSRDSFNLLQTFSRVLMQQGRVQLDADWNEQADSLLYYLRALASDVIGPMGGRELAFKPDHVLDEKGNPKDDKDFTIRAGHYYVDGILSVNDPVDKQDFITYTQQPYNPRPYPDDQDLSKLRGKLLAYLDVWERQVTILEDDSIREVALGAGGPDTATRGQIVWQVRVINLDTVVKQVTPDLQKKLQATPVPQLNVNELTGIKDALTAILQSENRGMLAASTNGTSESLTDHCTVSPTAKFRGEENQLYRVEVHTGGTPVSPTPPTQGARSGSRRQRAQQQGSTSDGPTFKWSRENGSVVFVVLDNTLSLTDKTVTLSLANLGRDDSRFTLTKNDWVELLTPDSSLRRIPGQMLQVSKVDYTSMQVVLTLPKGTTELDTTLPPPFLLRRWDHHGGIPEHGGLTIANDGAAKIIEDRPLNLENGIHITFNHTSLPPDGIAYRTGDYWLIPARTATGMIEWPTDRQNNALSLLPKGVNHHFAPLALITLTDSGTIKANDSSIIDLRSKFKSLIEIP
jgi:Family of unknown function (DUF6519)